MTNQKGAGILRLGGDQNTPPNQILASETLLKLGKYTLPLPYVIARKTRGSLVKQPGGIRITEEQELHTVRRQLERFPEAVDAILQAAHALRKPVANLKSVDVEACARHDKVAWRYSGPEVENARFGRTIDYTRL